ncbi:MAG: nucleotide exchange factor GrpE [Candidatus Competibacteraceae bacterium]
MTTLHTIEKLTAEAQQREREGYQADARTLAACETASGYWRAHAVRLYNGVKSARAIFSGELERFAEVHAEIPSRLQETWRNRQEGMRLLTKMLARLPERLAKVLEQQDPKPLPAPLNARQWNELLQQAGDLPSTYKRLEQALTAQDNARYQRIFQAREQTVKLRQGILDCVAKQLLPVLDGLDEGERLSRPLIEESRQESTAVANIVIAWCNSYAVLRAQLASILEHIGIRPIMVEPGTLIDYRRHEPCAVESNPTAADESIKAEIRKGYEYTGEDGQVHLLRPAQVIVFQR